MNQQRNKYNGEIDRATKKREGFGIYQYENQFFQYQGDYRQGVKEGKGKLLMKDGTVIEGEFKGGELQGYAEMISPNGNYYKGTYQQGDKHGQGEWLFRGDLYKGEFQMNCKHGKGSLHKANGDVVEGDFQDNLFHGQVAIQYANGDQFQGQMHLDHKQGNGRFIEQESGITYQGEWHAGLRHGTGEEIFNQSSGEYRYKGGWQENQKSDYPNQMSLQAPMPLEFELGGPAIPMSLRFEFKGEDVIDPVQPSEEEIQQQIEAFHKESKKNKSSQQIQAPDFHAPRMIPVEAVLREGENGRKVQVLFFAAGEGECDYLDGSHPPMLFDYRERLAQKRLENSRLKQQILEAQQQTNEGEETKDYKAKKKERANKELLSQQINMEDLEQTKVFEQVSQEQVEDYVLLSHEGVVDLGLVELPTDFPPGKYILLFKDITDPRAGHRMPTVQHELLVRLNPIAEKAKKKK